MAIDRYKKALDIALISPRKTSEGRSLSNLGIAYEELVRFDKTLDLYRKACEIADICNDEMGKAARIKRLGSVLQKMGDTASAIENYAKAHTLACERDFRETETQTPGDLVFAYFLSGNSERAFFQFESALGNAYDFGDPVITAAILCDLGFMHHYMQHLDEAFACYEKGLSFQTPVSSFLCAAYLGVLSLEKRDSQKASKYLSEADTLCHIILDKTPDFLTARYSLAFCSLATCTNANQARTAYWEALQLSSARGVAQRALMDLSLLERAAPSTPGTGEVKVLLDEAFAKDPGSFSTPHN